LFGLGDAVVVDVIRWIGQYYLLPVLRPVPVEDAEEPSLSAPSAHHASSSVNLIPLIATHR
jgi:hypothetical protein